MAILTNDLEVSVDSTELFLEVPLCLTSLLKPNIFTFCFRIDVTESESML
jgi:hypothetical protein